MVRIGFESSALTDAKTATRLDEVRAWMARHDLDAALVTRPVSIAYLTGVRVDPHERLMALAIRPDRATLILPAIERENAERAKTDADIASWRDGEDPYRLVHDALAGAVRLGVEKEHMTLAVADVLRERLHTREMFDMALEIRRLRRTKSPVELEKLAHAAAITDAATEEILSRLHGGQTELEVALAIGASIAAAGGTPAFETIVLSGPNSALPHGRPSGQRLREGDLVLLDFGAAYDGYCADTTRVAVVGAPTARQREIHGLVLAAHDAAIDAVRAGATTGDVDSAARKVIETAGLGDRFFHRTGHGLGLEAHEDPSLDPGSKAVLEVGMVFTVEPGIYIPGWGGVRIEDDVVVEADGCRLLTKADRSLRTVPD
jgi:Xaa-Pro dipeptidase